jgi:hypothetical protein
MQERQFDRPVLGEQDGGVLAARDGGEEFEQQGLGVFHCDGLSEPGVTAAALPTRHDIIRSAIEVYWARMETIIPGDGTIVSEAPLMERP